MFIRYRQYGITLLEAMIVIAIVSIVVTLGAPSVVKSFQQMRHKGAVETAYFTLQSARANAISSASDITVSFNTTTPWCIGLSEAGACNCNVANSCTINGLEQTIKAADFDGITLQEVNFSGNNFSVFDGQRGLAIDNDGSFVFATSANEARLTVNPMGRVSICIESGDLGGYESC